MGPVKIRVDGVSKVFGRDPKGALAKVHAGMDKTRLKDETDHVLGLHDITLDIHGTVIERLDLPVEDVGETGSEEAEDEELAAPLALAIDVSEPDAESAAQPPQTPGPAAD